MASYAYKLRENYAVGSLNFKQGRISPGCFHIPNGHAREKYVFSYYSINYKEYINDIYSFDF